MAALFEAYITNLGKYNEGELVGETLKFPTTTEEVQALLKRIGVDGVRYEEFFITSFDGDVLGLYDYLTEYENLDELNHLACLLSELDQSDLEKFEAVIDSGEHTSSVADLINLTQNLDCFEFYPGVGDDETLGRIYVEDMEAIDVPEHLLNYFDYEAYGRDIRINEDGHFAPGGYVLNNGGKFISTTTGSRTSPPSTGFSPIRNFLSGNRWRLTKSLLMVPLWKAIGNFPIRSVRNDRRHFETLCPEAATGKEAV